LKIESFRRVLGSFILVPQDLREGYASVSGKNIPPTPAPLDDELMMKFKSAISEGGGFLDEIKEGEGRLQGTLPLLLGIVLTQKMRGHKTISRKSRNSYRLNGGGVGAHRQLTPGPDVLSPGTKYKRSKWFLCHMY